MAFGGADAVPPLSTTTFDDAGDDDDEDLVAVHYLEEEPNPYVLDNLEGRRRGCRDGDLG